MRALPLPFDPSLLVGLSPADDAAVIRLSDELALVFTTDFFTPLVDSPRVFGRIAAANALSDVYAMGGRPLVALNIVAFPTRTLGVDILAEVLLGGADVAHEAGISIAGGHSVEDAEPKYGLAVIGTVHPQRVWRKSGAISGDSLVLTKALGTGVLATALKRDVLSEADPRMQSAIASMTALNALAAQEINALGIQVHAVTDVTGYGLVGHLGEVLRAGHNVCAVLHANALPLLDGALDLARADVLPGGTRANRTYVSPWFDVARDVDEPMAWLSCDAQTSGGLLIAAPPADAVRLTERLVSLGCAAAVVGEIVAGPDARVALEA